MSLFSKKKWSIPLNLKLSRLFFCILSSFLSFFLFTSHLLLLLSLALSSLSIFIHISSPLLSSSYLVSSSVLSPCHLISYCFSSVFFLLTTSCLIWSLLFLISSNVFHVTSSPFQLFSCTHLLILSCVVSSCLVFFFYLFSSNLLFLSCLFFSPVVVSGLVSLCFLFSHPVCALIFLFLFLILLIYFSPFVIEFVFSSLLIRSILFSIDCCCFVLLGL